VREAPRCVAVARIVSRSVCLLFVFLSSFSLKIKRIFTFFRLIVIDSYLCYFAKKNHRARATIINHAARQRHNDNDLRVPVNLHMHAACAPAATAYREQ
jgi:hypothetical protein